MRDVLNITRLVDLVSERCEPYLLVVLPARKRTLHVGWMRLVAAALI